MPDNLLSPLLRALGFSTTSQEGDSDNFYFDNHGLVTQVRGENTDTDDAWGIYVLGRTVTTKVFNILKNGTAYFNGSPVAVLSASTNVTLGTAAAAGSGTAALRSDATILAYDSTNPSPVGSVASPGSSSLAARRDHYHLGVTSIAASGNSALSGAVRLYAGSGVGLSQIADGIQITASTASVAASAGVPVVILGTTNAAGAIGTFLDVGSRIQIYDGTAPTAMTVGGSVTQGVGSFAARSDHGHALSNTNVTLLGGSWGSGPTLTNPQIAATGWASANHAHAAANSGGTLSFNTIVLTKAEITGSVTTTSATPVLLTGLSISTNVSASANPIKYSSFVNCFDSAVGNHKHRIYNTTDSTIIQQGNQNMTVANFYYTMSLIRFTTQATGAKTIEHQWLTSSGGTATFLVDASTTVGTIFAEEVR